MKREYNETSCKNAAGQDRREGRTGDKDNTITCALEPSVAPCIVAMDAQELQWGAMPWGGALCTHQSWLHCVLAETGNTGQGTGPVILLRDPLS